MGRVKFNLIFKVTMLIVVLIVMVSSITNYLIFSLADKALKDEIKDKLRLIAANAVLTLDTEKLKAIKDSEDEGSPDYLELQKKLQGIQTASEEKLRYIYTLIKVGDGNKYKYILDATPIGDEDHSAIGDDFIMDEKYKYWNVIAEGFSYPTVEPEPSVDEEFNTISQSGFAPIKDKSGKVIGIIGIDMDLSTLKQEQAQMRNAITTTIISAVLLALLLGFMFSKYLTEPILILTRGTRKIAEGNFDTVVNVKRNDEFGQLATSFNSMTQDLKVSHDKLRRYSLELEDKVAQRTLELSRSNKEIKDILDNMSQAIFTIDEDLKFNPQHSRFAYEIFGNIDFADKNLLEMFFKDEEQKKDKENMQAWLKKVFEEDDISWENVKALLPVKEVKIKALNGKGQNITKFIQVDFQPIKDDNDGFTKLMVIVQDITDKKALELEIENKEKEYKDNINQIVEIIRMDQELFEDFIKECNDQMLNFEPKLIELKDHKENSELVNDLFRIMHTIKGNAKIFNLERIAGEAHAIENIFSSIRKGEAVMTDELLDDTFKKIDHFNILFKETLEMYNKIINSKNTDAGKPSSDGIQNIESNIIKVKVEQLDKLTEMVDKVDSLVLENVRESMTKLMDSQKIEQIESLLKEMMKQLQELRRITMGKLFNRFPRMVRDISTELGKKVKFIAKGDNIEVDRNIFDRIADPLIHLIRNSLDHGIEKPEERISLGKPEEGVIEVNVSSTDSELLVEIHDDGKGLDVDRIKAKAVTKGLITPEKALNMTDDEAVNIIFLPGFSTSENVSDISGRGVGMDVVRTFVEEKLHGTVQLESKKNQGLKVILKVPMAS